jgi:hypothetical protein
MADNLKKPTAYTRKIGFTICGRLLEGETLREICRDPGMPAKPTVMRWLTQHEEFRKDCELAREMQLHDFCCESTAALDEAFGHHVEKVRRDGNVVMVSDHDKFSRALLRSEVRYWVADHLPPNPHYASAKKGRS